MFIVDTLKKYVKYKNTAAELRRMSDRDLSDIGIRRCDIDRIAMQSVW